jgi:hypothetical protein
LSDASIAKWFKYFRTKHPSIARYEHRKETDVHFMNNGPVTDFRSEMYVKVEKGTSASLAFGGDVPSDAVMSCVRTLLDPDAGVLEPFQVTDFDFQWTVDLEYQGNHYEAIGRALYSKDSIGQCYASLAADEGLEFNMRDNDVRLLAALGGNKTLAVSVVGRTSRSEIASGEYEKKDITVRAGVLVESASLGEGSLAEKARAHIEWCEGVFATHLVPNIVRPLQDAIDALASRQ